MSASIPKDAPNYNGQNAARPENPEQHATLEAILRAAPGKLSG